MRRANEPEHAPASRERRRVGVRGEAFLSARTRTRARECGVSQRFGWRVMCNLLPSQPLGLGFAQHLGANRARRLGRRRFALVESSKTWPGMWVAGVPALARPRPVNSAPVAGSVSGGSGTQAEIPKMESSGRGRTAPRAQARRHVNRSIFRRRARGGGAFGRQARGRFRTRARAAFRLTGTPARPRQGPESGISPESGVRTGAAEKASGRRRVELGSASGGRPGENAWRRVGDGAERQRPHPPGSGQKAGVQLEPCRPATGGRERPQAPSTKERKRRRAEADAKPSREPLSRPGNAEHGEKEAGERRPQRSPKPRRKRGTPERGDGRSSPHAKRTETDSGQARRPAHRDRAERDAPATTRSQRKAEPGKPIAHARNSRLRIAAAPTALSSCPHGGRRRMVIQSDQVTEFICGLQAACAPAMRVVRCSSSPTK